MCLRLQARLARPQVLRYRPGRPPEQGVHPEGFGRLHPQTETRSAEAKGAGGEDQDPGGAEQEATAQDSGEPLSSPRFEAKRYLTQSRHQEYEAQLNAYGIPIDSCTWKAVPTTAVLLGKASTVAPSTTHPQSAPNSNPRHGAKAAAAAATTPTTTTTGTNTTVIRRLPVNHAMTKGPCPPTPPDMEACHLSSKQLEDLMDDEEGGPVSNGDPMLSSPHLSPHLSSSSSPPPSSHHYEDDDANATMELAA